MSALVEATDFVGMRDDRKNNLFSILAALAAHPDTPVSARKIAALPDTPSVSGVHGVLDHVRFILDTAPHQQAPDHKTLETAGFAEHLKLARLYHSKEAVPAPEPEPETPKPEVPEEVERILVRDKNWFANRTDIGLDWVQYRPSEEIRELVRKGCEQNSQLVTLVNRTRCIADGAGTDADYIDLFGLTRNKYEALDIKPHLFNPHVFAGELVGMWYDAGGPVHDRDERRIDTTDMGMFALAHAIFGRFAGELWVSPDGKRAAWLIDGKGTHFRCHTSMFEIQEYLDYLDEYWERVDAQPEQQPEPERKETPMPTPAPADESKLDPIAAMIWQQIKPLVGGAVVTEDMVSEVVNEAIKKVVAPTIEVINPPAPPKEMPRQHYMFELVMRIMSCNIPLYLWGGAGSSKTSLLMACAQALELPCNVVSFSKDTTRSQMMGYVGLNGERVPSLIHDAFVNGKFLVMDEFDAGGVGQLVLNALLANGVAEFYGEMAEAHPNFFVGVTANTPGTGAANGYRREPVDAATRDRMFVLELPLDEGLEAHICGVSKKSPKLVLDKGGVLSPEAWHDLIVQYRKAFKSVGIKTTLESSMRPAKMGAVLAANGIGRHWLEEGLIRRGLAEDSWVKVKEAVK